MVQVCLAASEIGLVTTVGMNDDLKLRKKQWWWWLYYDEIGVRMAQVMLMEQYAESGMSLMKARVK